MRFWILCLAVCCHIGSVFADDDIPDAFAFDWLTGVAPNAVVTSRPARISGLSDGVGTFTAIEGPGEYCIRSTNSCDGACDLRDWGRDLGLVANGDYLCVRHQASATPGASTSTTVDAGHVAATFTSTTAATPGRLAVSTQELSFGRQSSGTQSAPASIVVENVGDVAIGINSVATAGSFRLVAASCAVSIAPGQSCVYQVASVAPVLAGPVNAEAPAAGFLVLQFDESKHPGISVRLSALVEKSLVPHYYRSILGREPDAQGHAFWKSEAARVVALGADVNEVWFAMAAAFLGSDEYLGSGKDGVRYVTDLYTTFFSRAPDQGGLDYWTSLLAAGMPRGVVMTSFMLSAEFDAFSRRIFGNASTRAEEDVVIDFYRGLLGRLPDDAGYRYWVDRFRAAQCAGASRVYEEVEAISSSFLASAEYAARGRSHGDFVGDLYNAFLRRGGDLEGVRFWVDQLSSGARSRADLRRAFLRSPEFSAEVDAIVSEGCVQ